MTSKGWEKTTIILTNDIDSNCSPSDKGSYKIVEGIAPVIISASRATDIPAFYSDWFIERFRKGYMKWVNPFNQKEQYISFNKTRVFVFWSKNPKNLIKYLPEIDAKGINYYFLFTLNDYEDENLEPNIPSLENRIKTFIELSEKLGKDRVIWRFDPLILSDSITIEKLLLKIKRVGDQIYRFTNKLVISFVDIDVYQKVRQNLNKSGLKNYREFTDEEKIQFAEKLAELNQNWNLNLFTCAEEIDLSKFSIEKNSCIDYFLLINLFSEDKELKKFLHPSTQTQITSFDPKKNAKLLKDPGQRSECGCIYSKDIGQYNTCMHLCKYCYANHSTAIVRNNYERYIRRSDSGSFDESIIQK
jgi:DNA repair photolyase